MFKNYKKTVFILIGIQASGKSTFCKQFFPGQEYISMDILKNRRKETRLFNQLLAEGKNCIIDNTNPAKIDRAKYLQKGKAEGYKLVGLYFRSALSETLKRNEERLSKAKIPLQGILATAKKLEAPSYKEGFDELYYIKIENETFAISKWNEDL